ncbi:MAG: HAMP domain-containing sensor histidine kinase [Bacteroidota bacterium]
MRQLMERVDGDPAVAEAAQLEWMRKAIRFHPDSLLLVAEDLAVRYEGRRDTNFWARSLSLIGQTRYFLTQFEEAEPYLVRAIQLHLSTGDTLEAGGSSAILGDLYRAMGRFEDGQKVLLWTCRLVRDQPQKKVLAMAEFGLGNIYYNVGKFAASIKSYRNSYQHNREIGDSLGASKALSGIANCEASRQNNRSSLEYSRQSLALMKPVGTSAELAYQYFSLGDIFEVIGQLDSSRYYYLKCLEYAEASNIETYIIWGHFGLVEHYIFTRQLASARRHLDSVRTIAQMNQDYMVQKQVIDLDLKIAEAAEDYETAYQLRNQQIDMEDSLLDKEKAKAIEELTIRFDTELKEAENAALKSENALILQRQNTTLMVSITVVALLLLVLVVFFSLFQRMRNLNQQLMEANGEKDALMGIVAHDLKSPLRKVGALIGAMQGAELLGSSHHLFVEKIEKAISQGENLIGELESIVDLERKEAKELVPVQLDKVVGQVAESFAPVAQKKSTRIHTHCETLPGPVATYRDSLDRILGNLLSNAIKFSPPASQVDIYVAATPTHAQAKIVDKGPGIPEDELPKLFRKFSRLSPRPTAGESSTGLGLYIVQLLVEQVNGTIVVNSVLGEGTEFILEFPLLQAHQTVG